MPGVAAQPGGRGASAGATLIRNGVDVTPPPPTSQQRYEELMVWMQALADSTKFFVNDRPDHIGNSIEAMQTASDQVNQALERLVHTKYGEVT